MRKLILYYFIFAYSFLLAGVVSTHEATTVAKNIFIEKNPLYKQGDFSISSVEIIESNSTPLIYIFHLKPKGFILVSAEDRAIPNLGYSLDNNFRSEGLPSNIGYLINLFKSEIKELSTSNTKANEFIKNDWKKYLSGNVLKRSSRNVSPLLEAKFDQGGAWNNLVTQEIGANVPVGCVAVAMCQVMYYWSHPYIGVGSNYYYHIDYGLIEADFESAYYNFNDMSPVTATSASQLLLYHAGVAINMDYSPSGSGAYVVGGYPSAGDALKNNFDYSQDMQYIHKNNYESNTDEFRAILENELNNNRPIVYRGYGGYNNGSGHAWNIDGYDANQLHCNWGWGGYNNGYFSLSSMGGFSSDQAAIIGIVPNFDLPTAVFEYEVDDLTVTFFDISQDLSNTPINYWIWDLGDGTTITSSNSAYDPNNGSIFQYNYDNGGTYLVTLNVENIYGQLSEPYTDYITLIEPVAGDVNDDDLVNVLDIVALVNIVLDSDLFINNADLNNDGINNILDIIALVNMVLNSF